MTIPMRHEMSSDAYESYLALLVKFNRKYGHQIAAEKQKDDICTLTMQSIPQSGASVEPEKVPEIAPQPVRNRRRRRHNKCVEESAASI